MVTIMAEFEKPIITVVFVLCYALALSRKVKIAYASLGAAAVLMLFGYVKPGEALFKAIKWDVLGIYWGFMMVSYVFMKSRMPEVIANFIIERVKVEKYVLLSLCGLTAFLSAFMENVGVVLMMAPVALTVSRIMNSDFFVYMVSVAISSNVVTTLTMVADPPPIILAMETGMKPLDFYVFQGRPGLGTITFFSVLAALGALLFQFRKMNRRMEMHPEKIEASKGATVLFIAGVAGLAVSPEFNIRPGIVGLLSGLIALYMGRDELKRMIVEFDWNSIFFIMGVFIVIYSLSSSGVLKDFAGVIAQAGLGDPASMLFLVIWVSVAFSSFMDNVPYTILMIPVCQSLAETVGIEAWSLLYGMLIGTGVGGNITPVGATANVFACGILETQGIKVQLGRYLSLSIPFSLAAVFVAHLLLHWIWL